MERQWRSSREEWLRERVNVGLIGGRTIAQIARAEGISDGMVGK